MTAWNASADTETVIGMVAAIIPELIARGCRDLDWRDHGRLGKHYGKVSDEIQGCSRTEKKKKLEQGEYKLRSERQASIVTVELKVVF